MNKSNGLLFSNLFFYQLNRANNININKKQSFYNQFTKQIQRFVQQGQMLGNTVLQKKGADITGVELAKQNFKTKKFVQLIV